MKKIVLENRKSLTHLLQTAWGQGTGYNNLVPHSGCSNYSNGRAPTGCVATAMAQIMKFHEYPSTYNWSIMPDLYGSNETSRLMLDIGSAVDMKYTCNGSSTSTKGEIPNAFVSRFGYASARYANYVNSDIILQELRRSRPVILNGGRNSRWWIFGVYADGHAWVCDGFRHSVTYSDDCSTGWVTVYLSMNWGWNRAYDGWYLSNNWNPGEHTFYYKRGIVYDIRP